MQTKCDSAHKAYNIYDCALWGIHDAITFIQSIIQTSQNPKSKLVAEVVIYFDLQPTVRFWWVSCFCAMTIKQSLQRRELVLATPLQNILFDVSGWEFVNWKP